MIFKERRFQLNPNFLFLPSHAGNRFWRESEKEKNFQGEREREGKVTSGTKRKNIKGREKGKGRRRKRNRRRGGDVGDWVTAATAVFAGDFNRFVFFVLFDFFVLNFSISFLLSHFLICFWLDLKPQIPNFFYLSKNLSYL